MAITEPNEWHPFKVEQDGKDLKIDISIPKFAGSQKPTKPFKVEVTMLACNAEATASINEELDFNVIQLGIPRACDGADGQELLDDGK